jgi:hypothetical protein
MGGLVFTQDAVRQRGQGGKRLGFFGARVSGWLRGCDGLTPHSGMIGPQRAEHQEDTHQRHEPTVVEKERRYHGNAPEDGDVRRTLYRVFGLNELSAVVLYTTDCEQTIQWCDMLSQLTPKTSRWQAEMLGQKSMSSLMTHSKGE